MVRRKYAEETRNEEIARFKVSEVGMGWRGGEMRVKKVQMRPETLNASAGSKVQLEMITKTLNSDKCFQAGN